MMVADKERIETGPGGGASAIDHLIRALPDITDAVGALDGYAYVHRGIPALMRKRFH